MATWLFWTLIILQVLGIVANTYMIGRPRKPIDGITWAISTVIGVLIIIALFVWGNPA